ncbi:unnamed protein product, partial [Ectocarpus sp. 8 AP-2014]
STPNTTASRKVVREKTKQSSPRTQQSNPHTHVKQHYVFERSLPSAATANKRDLFWTRHRIGISKNDKIHPQQSRSGISNNNKNNGNNHGDSRTKHHSLRAPFR